MKIAKGNMQVTLLVLKSGLSLVLYLQEQRLSILSSWINRLDHQAIIPEWEGCLNVNLGSSATTKLSGTCVVPMSALNMPENMDDIVGKGREFCVCRDRGSIRCVCQHVK